MNTILKNNINLVYELTKLKDKYKIALNGLEAIAQEGNPNIAQQTLDEINKDD